VIGINEIEYVISKQRRDSLRCTVFIRNENPMHDFIIKLSLPSSPRKRGQRTLLNVSNQTSSLLLPSLLLVGPIPHYRSHLAFCLETLSRRNSKSACCNLAFRMEASLLAVDSLLHRAAWHLSSGLNLRPSCLYTQTKRRGWEAGAVQYVTRWAQYSVRPWSFVVAVRPPLVTVSRMQTSGLLLLT